MLPPLFSSGGSLSLSEDLVARIQEGDRGAEEELFTSFGRAVAIILDRHTNGRPEAEDLFQETFRLALEKLRRGELRDPSRLPGFLAGIARSLAIEHFRKAARRRTDADSEAVEWAPAAGDGPLSGLIERESADLVRDVLRGLGNARDRQILLRFYLAEEDKDLIAADLGLTSLQFNRVLHRARQRYKELFERRTGRTRAVLLALGIILFLVPLWGGGRRPGGG